MTVVVPFRSAAPLSAPTATDGRSLLIAVPAADRRSRVLLFAAWLMLVAWLEAHHVFWRDEVRAFTLALSGDGLTGMLRAIHGEGHPALWYLSLRAVHAIAPVREALPATGLLFGAAAAALFASRAPFRPFVVAVVLFSGWLTYEYTVMARNYGVAALLMFVVADRMAAGERRGWVIGLLLALLVNANVPATLFAGGYLLVWGIELAGTRRPEWRQWLVAAALTVAGALASFATVYPPVHDAAVSPLSAGLTPARLGAMALDLVSPMSNLVPEWWWTVPGVSLLLAVLLLASPLSLARRPGTFAAALVVLPALTLFFQLVYWGGYRHQALYLPYLLSLHWMAAAGRGGAWPEAARRALGRIPAQADGAFLALLAIQVATLMLPVAAAAHGQVAGRARDLGVILRRPDLARAVVLAEPDQVVEALPYYAPNPTWLVRERRWGSVSHFTRKLTLDLTLGDVLATARRLHASTGRPVVIATELRLEPGMKADTWREGYAGTFAMTPAQVRDFLGATRRLARFGPTLTDESYDVYVLR